MVKPEFYYNKIHFFTYFLIHLQEADYRILVNVKDTPTHERQLQRARTQGHGQRCGDWREGGDGGGGGYRGTNGDRKIKQLQSNDPEGICPKESQVRVRVCEGALAT